MDRALKERVIGAVVLVVIAVLVVPVFLDGPSTVDEIVSEPVTLPGQNGQPRKRQTIVLERDRDQPVPASARQGGRSPSEVNPEEAGESRDEGARLQLEPVPEPAVAAVEADPEPETETAPSPPPEESSTAANVTPEESAPDPAPATGSEPAAGSSTQSATGMWAVQLGSFAKRSNAEGLAADLRSNGYAAFLSQVQTASGELNRVRIGPQKDRKSAEAVAAKLKADGLKGQVVPHP